MTQLLTRANQDFRDTSYSNIEGQISNFPEFRYMGSKRRLLPWIYEVLNEIDFESSADPFSGSASVSYLMKAMGRRVVSSDYLNFSTTIAKAIIENNSINVDSKTINSLLKKNNTSEHFIEKTFSGIFYTHEDLKFLDNTSKNINKLENPHQKAIAMSALLRSAIKKQPRGVFTISGDLSRYDDGRRDLQLSFTEHFIEQLEYFNNAVFSNGKRNSAKQEEVFNARNKGIDLVYLDPPYVPRSDDNCYVKRYHFLEGLSCYWQGLEIDYSTKVRKIPKKYTPFSYRSKSIEAFEKMFHRYKNQKVVLSYSSNGYPDLDILVELLSRTKRSVEVYTKDHRYHFGTHNAVKRSSVKEYLVVGQ